MNRSIASGLAVLAILITSCTSEVSPALEHEELYLEMKEDLKKLPTDSLMLLMDKGILSARSEFGGRHCISSNNSDHEICYKLTLESANLGHPHAMRQVALFMTNENAPADDLYEAYKWIWIKSHFVRDIYYFDHDIVRGFQEAEQESDYVLIRYLENELGTEKVTQARKDAEIKMLELSKKLEDYCEDWAEEDYVCFYRLGEQPSYKKYEKYVKEKYGL